MTEDIPTGFTPNGDGLNDVFRVVGLKYQDLVDFRVYNRWGQQVFYTNNYKDGWDGTFNGVKQDMGTYFYTIIVARPGGAGNDIVYKGEVTLIR
jgi:gliding motility-associated-like protein